MPRQFIRQLKKRFGRTYKDINPEDIFLDSTNLPKLSQDRFEGRMEKPIGETTFLLVKILLLLILVFLGGRLWILEINKGEAYTAISENNRLDRTTIFADRGIIYDRSDIPLAANAVKEGTTTEFA